MGKSHHLLATAVFAGALAGTSPAQSVYSLGEFVQDVLGKRIGGSPSREAGLSRWGDDLVDPDLGYVPGEVLVKFRPGRPFSAVAAARTAIGADEVRAFPDIGVRHWRFDRKRTPADAIAAMSRSAAAPWIEYAEPNYVWHVGQVPDDPLRGNLWGMHQVFSDHDIDALEAWIAGFTGSHDVVVGVIDTGIDYNHPDLAANMWVNPDEIAGNGIDDDGNGYVDDVHGADFHNGDGDPMDDHGHGSHTSGTIGAAGNNGLGVMGVSWNVRLMALKFLSAGGSGSTANAILAIDYAKAKGAVITNNSWGGGTKSNALSAAIASSNALFVASAGNAGSSSRQYPAAYDAPNIVSVAATDSQDGLASFSSYSPSWVDLGAPGVGVLSTMPNEGYGTMSGTSMAAPHVSGAAALLWAHTPSPSVSGVKATLMATVDALPSLAGKCVTGGRLNVGRALGAPPLDGDATPPAPVTDLAATANEEGEIVVTWTASGDDGADGTAYLTDLRYSTTGPIDDEEAWANSESATGEPCGPSGTPQSFVIGVARPGTTVYVGVKIVDKVGNISPLSNPAEATVPAGPWTIRAVTAVSSSYIGLDYDPATGHPAVAYGDYGANLVRFVAWDGASWSAPETVRGGYSGVSLAFDPASGVPAVSSVPGKVFFSVRSGGGWTSTQVAGGNNGRDISWLEYDPSGRPGIAYRANGLLYAYRPGSAWTTQTVHAGAGARYMCLAYDSNGRPGIAYSHDANGDGWLDSIWYAHHDGSVWSYEMVESGPSGYGVNAAIAFNPVTGYPAVAHRASGGAVRFVQFDGANWVGETPYVSPDGYAWGSSIAFRGDGTALFATGADGWMRLLTRDPASGTWTMEKVDWGDAFLFRVRVTADGRIGMAFNGWDGIVFGERAP